LNIIAQDKASIDDHYDVIFDSYEQPVIMYNIDENNSVYKASKIFHQSVDNILTYNNITNTSDISKGRRIAIPIDFRYVFRGANVNNFNNTKFIPIYYTVKPKETLYRISKVYCQEAVNDMMVRNNLTSKDLDIGQKLIIGWLALDNKTVNDISHSNQTVVGVVKPEVKSIKEETVSNVTSSSSNQTYNEGNIVVGTDVSIMDEVIAIDSIETLSPVVDFKKETGIAMWKQSSKGHSKFALHQTAKLNSEIELYNPLVQRTVKAKVIGRIPKGAYNEDVSVIISPATAVSLGALDHRFKVTMTYEESL
jgi:LysM repeat protein